MVSPEPLLEISEEFKNLIYYKGDEKASKVLINAQGGPDTELSTGEVDFLFENFDTTDLLLVNVHQAQTLNPSIVEGNDITIEQAINLSVSQNGGKR